MKAGIAWGGSASFTQELRTCLGNREPVVSPTQEIIFHSCSMTIVNGHPQPQGRWWYHVGVGVLPRAHKGCSVVPPGSIHTQSRAWRSLVFSAFIPDGVFLQAQFPLFRPRLQDMDTLLEYITHKQRL